VNLTEVRQVIAETVNGYWSQAADVNPYAKSQPDPPGFQILPPGRAYDTPAFGMDEWTFMIQCFVAFTSDIGSQMLLDEMIGDGDGSMKTLLEADQTLGGLVQNVHVVSSSPGRMVDAPAGSPMLLVEWQLTVTALRD
jgi:hypothetical protein